MKRIEDLRITGSQLQSISELNLKDWGMNEPLHRAIIMAAISSLDAFVTEPDHDPITVELSAILNEEFDVLPKSYTNEKLLDVSSHLFNNHDSLYQSS